MAILGVRCSNTDIAYCVLSGTKDAPLVDATRLIPYPKGFSEPETLKWLHQEIIQVLGQHPCDAVAIKKPEVTVKRSNALEARIECEGVVTLAAADAGCLSVGRFVSASIAKGLGEKGRAKYLKVFDASAIREFDDYPLKVREAILVAWSVM